MSNTSLAVSPRRTAPMTWEPTKAEINIVRNNICNGMNDHQLSFCLNFSKTVGLNPIKRQIFFLKQNIKDKKTNQWYTKITPYVSLDGYRVIAHRSGRFDGVEGPFWIGTDGTEYDCLPADAECHAARYKVWVKGISRPFIATVYWREFGAPNQTDNGYSNWDKMPLHMIAKVAMSHAFRAAFPDELGAVPTEEELGAYSEHHYSVTINDEEERPAQAPPAPYQEPMGDMAPTVQQSDEERAEESKRKVLETSINDKIGQIWTKGTEIDWDAVNQELDDMKQHWGGWPRKYPKLDRWTTQQLEHCDTYLQSIVDTLAPEQAELTEPGFSDDAFSTDIPEGV